MLLFSNSEYRQSFNVRGQAVGRFTLIRRGLFLACCTCRSLGGNLELDKRRNGCTPFLSKNMYFKKIIVIIVAILSSISISAYNHNFNYDVQLIDDIYYEVEDIGFHQKNLVAYVIDVFNAPYVTNVTIPSTIKATWFDIAGKYMHDYQTDVPVVGIKRNYSTYSGFSNCKKLKTINIPSSVKNIDYGVLIIVFRAL